MSLLITIVILIFSYRKYQLLKGGIRTTAQVAPKRIIGLVVLALLPAIYAVTNGATNLVALIGLASGVILSGTLYYEWAHPIDESPKDDTVVTTDAESSTGRYDEDAL